MGKKRRTTNGNRCFSGKDPKVKTPLFDNKKRRKKRRKNRSS
ncbi:hypothetical protein [Pallidibacillus thermolactis]|nr:hypothetical protein [Pallidibacillus thermolactis]MCU9601300.1 hypothetical protein [Pallidibacillus thermolactis subsp. kokeshiiformis]MED1674894.1 hypothetical protein [Pallidibacillus thermolactis subsp. kokeshiiformis]